MALATKELQARMSKARSDKGVGSRWGDPERAEAAVAEMAAIRIENAIVNDRDSLTPEARAHLVRMLQTEK
ncbi:hypothetical protein ABZ154_12570 [Streptomyces sp. NPDC006261]|uniref:hypothetical protein n=1 Tax=Streptomyces sp. NPDC006261 TaxID=3156739 RepID=UPI0033A163AF